MTKDTLAICAIFALWNISAHFRPVETNDYGFLFWCVFLTFSVVAFFLPRRDASAQPAVGSDDE